MPGWMGSDDEQINSFHCFNPSLRQLLLFANKVKLSPLVVFGSVRKLKQEEKVIQSC